MKESKDEGKGRFQKFNIKSFEELLNDGRVYYPYDELQDLNVMLQCNSKKGVIVTGPEGSGKTTFIQSFVQQDLKSILGLESVKLIRIREIFLAQAKSANDIIDMFVSVIEDIEKEFGSQLILYVKAESMEKLETILKVLNTYYDELKSFYNLEFFKIIFEVTIREEKEHQRLNQVADRSYEVIYISTENDEERLINIVSLRVDDLSKIYGISCTKDVLFFFLVVINGVCDKGIRDIYNINYYISNLECAFIVSKGKGRTTLEKDIAEELYREPFEYLTKYTGEAVLTTAVHESGHTLLILLYEKYNKVKYVSIVPGCRFSGITVSGGAKKIPSMYDDRHFFINKIACGLAGRLAEEIVNKKYNPNSGACGDLKKVKSIINSMIYEFGLAENLEKDYIIVDSKENISEDLKTKIEKEKQSIIKEATLVAKVAILEHEQFIWNLAHRLEKELVVSGEDVHKMWDEYLDSKK